MRAPDVEARTLLRTVIALRERWNDSSITAGQRFSQLLGRLTFDKEALTWVRDALRASHAEEKREHEAAIGRLRAEYDRLQSRMHAMYVGKLDGKVDGAFFDRMSAEWRAERDRCLRETERHQAADQSYLGRRRATARTCA